LNVGVKNFFSQNYFIGTYITYIGILLNSSRNVQQFKKKEKIPTIAAFFEGKYKNSIG